MVVLFLDLDGVLTFFGDMNTPYLSQRTHSQKEMYEPHLVGRLSYICDQVPDLKIVISASDRYNMDMVKSKLVKCGFNHIDRIIGSTPYLHWRGDEIMAWLSGKDVSRYIVLDDDAEDIVGKHCNVINPKYFLRIDNTEGLSANNVHDIISFFNLFLDLPIQHKE